jgi:hypothetical protein
MQAGYRSLQPAQQAEQASFSRTKESQCSLLCCKLIA